MRQLFQIAGLQLALLGIMAVCGLIVSVQAQVRPPRSATQRTVDSLQQLTQPGYYSALFAAKQSTLDTHPVINTCNTYLCTPTNTPPVATTNANQTTAVGSTFSYTVNAFTDAQTPNSLTYAAVVTPDSNNTLSLNSTTRVLSGRFSAPGSVSVTITATDPGGLTAITSFTILVRPFIVGNSPLRASLAASSPTLLSTGTTALSATATGGTRPYSYRFTGPGTITPTSNTAIVSGLPTGVQTFTVLVTDAGSPTPQTISATVSVTVTAPPAASLQVLYQDADYGNTGNAIVKPFLQLSNTGEEAIPYQALTLRYWLTAEGNAPPTDLAVYYAPLGAVNMKYVPLGQPRQGAFGYIEYSFPTGGSLPGGGNSGPIENGIRKTDGSAFNELDDYSYQANSGTYQPNARITAYRLGADGKSVLIWGQEPTPVVSQTAVAIYSAAKDSPATSQIQTRLELRNTGNVALPVGDLKLRYYFTSDNNQLASIYVDYADIGASSVAARVIKLASPVDGADSYAELSFPGNTTQLNALSSLGGIDFRLVRSDYGLFDQTNDYSYTSNYGSVGLNNKITTYLNNQLIFGTPPLGAAARVAVSEPVLALQVKALGNPVVSSQAQIEIRGVQGQAVTLRLVDLQGRLVHEQCIEQAGDIEQVSLPLGTGQGTLLLNVSTVSQQQSLKLLRP
ncbi:cellulose binding domain-containing protein [Spirosoma lituiforme]